MIEEQDKSPEAQDRLIEPTESKNKTSLPSVLPFSQKPEESKTSSARSLRKEKWTFWTMSK